MQLASSGFRALKGAQAHFFPSGGGGTAQAATRAIHIPAFAPRPAATSQVTSTAQSIVKNTRTILSRFVAHLTTPGTLRVPGDVVAGASRARALHTPATRMPTIHERMSYPARCFLSRPAQVPFLPRAPAVPRNITQVGLGTARNFSSGRPVFQHLAENVPIYARAFSEADWKVRMQEEKERLRLEKAKAKAQSKAARKAKAPLRPLKPVVRAGAASTTKGETQEELEHYFPTPATPEVITHLLIPLAPTPTSRLPLAPNPPSSSRPLLPLELIASMHASHGTHALRVSTLFARLDASRVFDDPGVHCEARGDMSGLCTVLEVRFEGWTANRVRSVLGEAGTGWCALEEVWRDQDRQEAEEMDAALEALSGASEAESDLHSASLSGLSDINGSWDASATIDPARSFVLPTLDFSASFAAPTWSPPASVQPPGTSTPMSDLQFHNEWSEIEDGLSSPGSFDYDFGGSDVDSVGSGWHSNPSARGVSRRDDDSWFGFSSQFSERMGEVDGPREYLF
ncbi:hypothetical protein C8Q70DRAFT_936225 [Cubamyces menziesii]|uniref:Uncharacterized protein n=1 Tax=Trametes cubensis TaxID=1111947 RepID=A0AAD7TLW1_9APHY|nr:hypothetical protein C8Q70DRAFT_936225 [Cubamyces menziesii]KAJ8463009.1 hypothetical protein ONZ51_g10536 [Trametes cubensis]